MKEKFAKLIDVKSIVTLLMTIALVVLMFVNVEINKELLMLFSTSYGAVITYFFTKKKENKESEPKEKNDNKDNKKDNKKSNKKKIIIASCVSSEAIHFRDVKIGVKKIERMSVKNLIRGWGGYKI